MVIKHIYAVCFSPTGNARSCGLSVAELLGQALQADVSEIDITEKKKRGELYQFRSTDLVILSSPVYAGRLPNKIAPELERCIKGSGTCAVALTVFGNRSYDGALVELKQLAERKGLIPVAAAAIVTEHVFSKVMGKGRPDRADCQALRSWGEETANKIKKGSSPETIRLTSVLKEELPPYYIPRGLDGSPTSFLKVKPVTDKTLCSHCGRCVSVCPMGSISAEEPWEMMGICIKCQACIKTCPEQARFFTDEQFLSHVQMLERDYSRRAENFFEV